MMPVLADLMNRMRGRLTCGETLDLLQFHLDGELGAEEARRVARHLDHCSPCERETELYARIKAAIALGAPAADPDVLQRLERFGRRVANGEMID
jgi:anti-sigma factor RsiW